MIHDKIEIIKSYRKAYKNYFRVLLTLYIKQKNSYRENNIKVMLKNGKNMVLPYGFITSYARFIQYKNQNIKKLNLTSEGVSFYYKNHPIVLDIPPFSDPDAVFFREDYSFLNIKDEDVIDIGANIGDSAIYFALNNAKRVIALEPYPYAFSFAEKNIKLNHCENIILLNAGYGKNSKMFIDDKKISKGSSELIVSNNGGKEISIYSLEELINQYEIKDAILKIDCEGCEYNLLDEDNDVLQKLSKIQIEYHYGYEKLKEKLEKSGFIVRYTEPKKDYNLDFSNPNMVVGFIYAERNK
jgi:FkbM family methyltransferase